MRAARAGWWSCAWVLRKGSEDPTGPPGIVKHVAISWHGIGTDVRIARMMRGDGSRPAAAASMRCSATHQRLLPPRFPDRVRSAMLSEHPLPCIPESAVRFLTFAILPACLVAAGCNHSDQGAPAEMLAVGDEPALPVHLSHQQI